MQAEAQPAALAAAQAVLERPLLRGWFHLAGALAALGGGAWLLLIASSPAGYVGAAFFATSLVLLYSTSAAYHRVAWRTSHHGVIKRVDHAMIFVLIAGTYTPFCLDVSLSWGIPVLAIVWSLAGVAALAKVVRPDAPRWLGAGLAIALGWVAVVAAPEVIDRYAGAPLALLALGGAFYTAGGIIYALRRPDPWPRAFGYHEVFHALVVAGSVVHYCAIAFFVL